jgi:hypothetical protein
VNAFAKSGVRCYGGTLADWSSTAYCDTVDANSTTIRYDPTFAQTCVAALERITDTECSPTFDCPESPVIGLVPDGAPCRNDLECMTGASCSSVDGTMCVQPTCTRPSPAGGPCAPSCAPGAACDATTGLCVAGIGGDVGAVCGNYYSWACRDGLGCHARSTSPGAPYVCQRVEGAPCQQDSDCAPQDFCDTVCTVRFVEGTPCAAHPSGCKLLATCDAATMRCASAGHLGEPCGANGLCVDSWCDDSLPSPTCAPTKDTGQACIQAVECKSHACAGSVCVDCPA